MIVSIGMRTDIVSYYTPWLLKRIKEGFAYSRNPIYPSMVYRISLKPEDVDTMIFCSKNYNPILPYMENIKKIYPIYCYYTITAYEKDIEPNVPDIEESVSTLIRLSSIVGKQRVAWRYDPILFTTYTVQKHLERFEYLCSRLSAYVDRCIFSFVEYYPRFKTYLKEYIPLKQEEKEMILKGMGEIALKYGILLQSCGTDEDFQINHIHSSGCVTAEILSKANDIEFKNVKHKGIRQGCHCLEQRSIGAYDSCLSGCRYCYANKKPYECYKNYQMHDVDSPLLIGHLREEDQLIEPSLKRYRIKKEPSLFDL